MYRLILVIVCSFALLLTFSVKASSSADYSEKRVLLLYSYHPTFPTAPKVLEGLLAEFGEYPPVIEVEYMDSKRLYDQTSRDLFKKSFAYKVANRAPYDVIITADDNALNFVLSEGEALFPNVPFVFLGLNNIKLARLMGSNPLATGVVEAVSIKETIALAVNLFPKMESIHIIADGTTSGKSDLVSTQALEPTFPELKFSVLDLSELSWNELKEQIRALPSNDALLLLSAYRDKYQESVSFEKSLELIVSASSRPLFHPFEHGMGDGVLGGVLISHREQARQAAIKVKQILSATKAVDIPILDKSPNIVVVDKREMDRFGVSLSVLPEDAEIRYHEESTLVRYWKEIAVLSIIMVLMVLIIIILAHQNRQRASFAKALEETEQQLRTILDNIDAYVYMKDDKGRYLFANRLMRSLFRLSGSNIISKTDGELFNDHDSEQREVIDLEVIKTQKLYKLEESVWNPKSEVQQDLHTTKIPLLNENGETYALCGVSLDITAQKAHERQLKQIAHYDQLTGLPNRVLFSDRLAQAMKYAKRQGNVISVLYLDLDGFKEVNDTYGHIFGDRLLKVITGRIQQIIRSNDTAARLGGDEFIILLVNTGDPEDDLEVTQRVLNIVSEPMNIEGVTVSVSASIGITKYPQSEEIDADLLLRQADQAMYIAKNSGRNRYHFFNSDIERAAQQQEQLLSQVKSALDNREFRLFYQPKINLNNGCVVGLEALIRWEHPESGLLPPAMFLPGIEKHSLMVDIDDWVIGEALRQLEEWRRAGQEIPVSVNVSHMYFKQQNLAKVLTNELQAYPDVQGSLLELEILETQALDNLKEVAATIRDCQKLGITFALDDFGTGFSSLTYLKQLPINLLKVDRSFVIDMLVDEEDKSILEGILALCQAFEIKAIAEGLETDEHGIELKKMGYEYAQGYGISTPMPAHDVIDWIATWRAPDEWNCPRSDSWDYKI